ncbi:hypothetical protein [Nitrincola sp. A-D6]|uniref:hypothetical protein n=1 Tax=Nitrincola sp. A-D6 TaxID=1545442 RepID=UPI0011870DCB|nr:hypothetical protein [Nitrincola sp. A-D6]
MVEAINLSITRIDKDTIEVPSMVAMGINVWLKIIFFAIFFGSISGYDPGWFTKDGSPGVYYQDIHHMLFREESIISTFEFYEDKNNPGFLKDGTNYQDFKAELLALHGRGIGAGLFAIGLLVVPWILFNISVQNPVRFDRKRRIVYTWSRGCFMCIQLPENTGDPLAQIRAHIPHAPKVKDPHNPDGALVFWLPFPKKEANMPIGVGANCFIARAAIRYQAHYLRTFITDFMTNPDPQWLNQLGPKRKPKYVLWMDYFFYNIARLQLLPQFAFKKRKTEKAIEAFMQNPRTDLYPQDLPY